MTDSNCEDRMTLVINDNEEMQRKMLPSVYRSKYDGIKNCV
jgi:hypothetical protein